MVASLLGGVWVGSAVAVVAIGGVAWWLPAPRRGRAAVPGGAGRTRRAEDERRILVVANETVGGASCAT